MLIPGIILVFFGSAHLAILFYEWRRDRILFSTGTRTTARITDRVTYPDEDELQSSQYRLIGEFTDSDGYTHFVKSRRHACGSESRELMGTGMEVVYLPDDPDRALFALDEEKHISFWAAGGYSLVTAAGLFLVLLSLLPGVST
jgi:hypothetical protein